MIRGEVWWVRCPVPDGGEVRKSPPAVIVSNDAAIRHLNRVQVVPLTSNVGRIFPREAVIEVAGRRSKAMADQVTTAAKSRLIGPASRLSPADMDGVARACRATRAHGGSGRVTGFDIAQTFWITVTPSGTADWSITTS
jgi:mRNA interferase MazF